MNNSEQEPLTGHFSELSATSGGFHQQIVCSVVMEISRNDGHFCTLFLPSSAVWMENFYLQRLVERLFSHLNGPFQMYPLQCGRGLSCSLSNPFSKQIPHHFFKCFESPDDTAVPNRLTNTCVRLSSFISVKSCAV